MWLGSTTSEGMLSASEKARSKIGLFSEKEDTGLTSRVGDGAGLMEAVWMVSATSNAGSVILENKEEAKRDNHKGSKCRFVWVIDNSNPLWSGSQRKPGVHRGSVSRYSGELLGVP